MPDVVLSTWGGIGELEARGRFADACGRGGGVLRCIGRPCGELAAVFVVARLDDGRVAQVPMCLAHWLLSPFYPHETEG